MKRLSILGSTGSIGVNTLDIVSQFPERFEVVSLSAGLNTAASQAANPSVSAKDRLRSQSRTIGSPSKRASERTRRNRSRGRRAHSGSHPSGGRSGRFGHRGCGRPHPHPLRDQDREKRLLWPTKNLSSWRERS